MRKIEDIFRRLKFRSSGRSLVWNTPEEFRIRLNRLQEIVSVHESALENTQYAFFLLFVKGQEDIRQSLRFLSENLELDGILWFAYPKKSSKKYDSHLSREVGWDAIRQLGYEPIRQVAIDQDWSALRFREERYIRLLLRNRNHETSVGHQDKG